MSVVTDNYTLDLGEEGTLSLTKKIYDISEPDKRQSHFTKTITVPSTATNDLVFQGMFDVNFHLDQTDQFEPFFNPSKKAPCYLHTGTLEQVTGYAQLTDIVLNRYTNKVEYKLTIYGEIRDLFAELSNKRLSDLYLSEFNHTYNETSIINSWSAAIGTGYVYPMVDYGDDHKNYDFSTNRLPELNFWITEHFRPWIYVKTLVDKIIQGSGFKYSSAFFNTDLFKKLIYQGNIDGLVRDDSEVDLYSISAERTTNQSIGFVGNNRTAAWCYTNSALNFDSEVHDPQGQFLTPSIDVVNSIDYRLLANLNFTITNSTGIALTGTNNDWFNIAVCLIDDLGNIRSTNNFGRSLSAVGLVSWANGTTISFNFQVDSNVTLDSARTYKLCVRSFNYANNSTYSSLIDISFGTDSKLALIPQAEINFGDTVDISRMLDDRTQKDFMMDIVKMFNLYIEPYWFRSGDANSGEVNTYLIEPRDDYFTDDVIDWTDNLDIEKDFVIKPLGLAENKFLKFTYTADNDKYNQIYTGQSGRIMGDYIHEIDNDFAKNTKEIKINIAPTILTNQFNPNHYKQPLPTIVTPDGKQRKDGKPRILFYNGLRNCGSWTFNDQGQYTQYPLASNVDDFDNPTCDLNFGHPSAIYYTGDSNGQFVFTNGTLFNRYYYKQVTETTDKNSKLVECYMRLRPSDIHNLSFRPYYFIKDAYYRLYEVVDHNYEDTTLCKFLKISEATPITNALIRTRGGRGTITGTTEKTPTKVGDRIPDTVGTGYGSLIVNGGGGILGSGTTGQGFVKNIAGNNNFVAGKFNQEILQDNIFAVGYNYIDQLTTDYTVTGMEGSPLYIIVDGISADITITLPDPDLYDGHIVYVMKDTPSHSVFVNDSTDTLVHTITSDGATHKFMLLAGRAVLLM